MSSFWSIWISVIVLGTIFGCAWLLWATRRNQASHEETEKTVGHSFDGIEEYDNPLPKWWFHLFNVTIVFALVYLLLYPGLGNFQGLLGWSSTNQWEKEMAQAEEKYGPIFERYANTPIKELIHNKDAMQMGQRLFANNCAVCHGSTAHGGVGFPNLTDNDWLYGGEPENIVQTITNGRNGNMPAHGLMPNMNKDQVEAVVNYVLSFSDRARNPELVDEGKQVFGQACAGCHGQDAHGNQQIGSPNLTDNTWLYGSDYAAIKHTVENGRSGMMPAQKEHLGEDKIHILAAYVYSLSHKDGTKQ
ncbi:cytochrome-c oxidase, cbb3-type subunit III [Marinobacteraceae bacterium S3BR75-40.1]